MRGISLIPLSLVVSMLLVLDSGAYYFRGQFAVKFVCQPRQQDAGVALRATLNYCEQLMHYW